MNFINKNHPKNRRNGHKIAKSLIDNQWVDNQYINLEYEALDMHSMEELLVKEQKGYCSYCMRCLRTSNENNASRNVTIEHIIPNKITEEDFQKDRKNYNKHFKIDKQHLAIYWKGKLGNTTRQLKLPPYPHFIAYENLVASCNGTIMESNKEIITPHHCCNNKRGQEFITPMFFIKNISEIINYDRRGNIDCEEKYAIYFQRNILNLMCDALNLYRRGWYHISNTDHTVDEIIRARRDKDLRDDIIDDTQLNPNDKISLQRKCCWDVFSDYSWFYNYYKKNKR